MAKFLNKSPVAVRGERASDQTTAMRLLGFGALLKGSWDVVSKGLEFLLRVL